MKKKRQLIVCLVGLVGAGKSTVAKELARILKATVVRSDDLRMELWKRGRSYDHVDEFLLQRMRSLLAQQRTVVVDADVIQGDKRKLVAREAKAFHVPIAFVRVVADPDVMFGRIVSATQAEKKLHPLFKHASSVWKGEAKGVVVKVRELWRRTPHHYRWTDEGGGRWVLRKLPFPVVATINTTDGKTWKKDVTQLVRRLV